MATNKNALYAYRYLQDKYKLKPHHAAGVVGNLIQESSMNTGALNPGDGRDGTDSIGIAQWNGSRARALRNFAGDKIGNLDTQLDFMMEEMVNGPERSAYDRLIASEDVHGATAAMIGYERPQGWSAKNPTAGHGWDNRLRYAGGLLGMSPEAIASAQPTHGSLEMAKADSPSLLATDPMPEAAKTETAEVKKPLIDIPKVLPDEIFGQKTENVGKLLGGLGDIFGKPTEDLNKQVQAAAARAGRRDTGPVVLTGAAQGQQGQQQQPQGSLPPHPANIKPWELLQLMMKQRGGRIV